MGKTAIIKVDIVGDSSSAVRASTRANAAFGRVGTGADQMGRKSDAAARKTGRLGTAVGGVVAKLGPLAAAAAGAGILKLGVDSIKSASDLEQAFAGIDAVFKGNARTVKRWAADAAESVGLAKSEYANLAVVTGSMFKNLGIEDFAGKTEQVIKLGADLAAQFGGSTKQAVEAIGSLFRGESDPIERYGVSIRQSAINAEIAARGLGKLDGKAKAQAETQARLKLLFEQTTDAQGAFARESGTLAQEQQKLRAKFENLKATLGEKLLPVASRVVEWLGNTITGSNDTGRALKRLWNAYQDFVKPTLDGMRKGLGYVNDALGGTKGKTDGIERALGKLVTAFEKVSPYVGKKYGKAWEALGWSMANTAAGINAVASAADWAAGKLEDLWDWANKVEQKSGILGDLLTGGIGLLRSSPLDTSGLGRAGGLGMVGATGGTTRVSVTSAPVVRVYLDGRALDDRMVRIAQSENTRTAIDYRRRG